MISQYSNLWGYVLDLYQNAEFGKTVDMFQIKQILFVSNLLFPWIVQSILDAKLSVVSFLFHCAICQPCISFRLSMILKLKKKTILMPSICYYRFRFKNKNKTNVPNTVKVSVWILEW